MAYIIFIKRTISFLLAFLTRVIDLTFKTNGSNAELQGYSACEIFLSEGFKKFNELLPRFPEQQQGFVDFFNKMSDTVRNLDSMFKDTKKQEKK